MAHIVMGCSVPRAGGCFAAHRYACVPRAVGAKLRLVQRGVWVKIWDTKTRFDEVCLPLFTTDICYRNLAESEFFYMTSVQRVHINPNW